MVTRVLTFEHPDGVVEHLTAQVPPDSDGGMMLPALLSWGGHVWKRDDDGVFRIASIWVPDREEFTSTILDEEDVEAMRLQEAVKAANEARKIAAEIATRVAEEVHGLDVSDSESMQYGWWIACTKIVEAIYLQVPRFTDRRIEQVPVSSQVDWARIACTAFAEYNSAGATPWKTFDGRDVPRWPALNDDVRAKWTAAVKAIVLDEQRRKSEAVSECETAILQTNRALAERRAVADALNDLLVLLGELPTTALKGESLEGAIARAKKWIGLDANATVGAERAAMCAERDEWKRKATFDPKHMRERDAAFARVKELEAALDTSRKFRDGREAYWTKRQTDLIAEIDRAGEGCAFHASRANQAEAERDALRAQLAEAVEALRGLRPTCITEPDCGGCLGCSARAFLAKHPEVSGG